MKNSKTYIKLITVPYIITPKVNLELIVNGYNGYTQTIIYHSGQWLWATRAFVRTPYIEDIFFWDSNGNSFVAREDEKQFLNNFSFIGKADYHEAIHHFNLVNYKLKLKI